MEDMVYISFDIKPQIGLEKAVVKKDFSIKIENWIITNFPNSIFMSGFTAASQLQMVRSSKFEIFISSFFVSLGIRSRLNGIFAQNEKSTLQLPLDIYCGTSLMKTDQIICVYGFRNLNKDNLL